MLSLVERHGSKIRGMLSCLDRVVIRGTLAEICHAQALEHYLFTQQVRLFDYARWAEPMREEIRANAERLAREAGLKIEFIQRNNFRKEERVKQILAERGSHPGLVHIFSAMEPCASFRPRFGKATGRRSLRPTQGKCLHYYFYFVDEELGLFYLRVPTWAPFWLQFYFNGHNRLACQLRTQGIGFEMEDNVFIAVENFDQAQQLAWHFDLERLHGLLDHFAELYCPVVTRFASGYHWSLMQVEYATDLIWTRSQDLAPLYDLLVREAVHTVRAEQVASFLGRKLHPLYNGELGTDFHTRIEGTRIKHHMGKASIKMYDKLGRVLRVETSKPLPESSRSTVSVERRPPPGGRRAGGGRERAARGTEYGSGPDRQVGLGTADPQQCREAEDRSPRHGSPAAILPRGTGPGRSTQEPA